MKLGILYSTLPSERTTDDDLVRAGIETLLAGHEVTYFYAPESHSSAQLHLLREQDHLIVSGEERWSGEAIRRFPWTREFFDSIGKRPLPLSLSLPGAGVGLADWAKAFLKFLSEGGQLSAADPVTFEWLSGALGKDGIAFTGSASLFAEFPRLHHREPRIVFCPPDLPGGGTQGQRDFVRDVYETVSVVSPALFLAHTANALELGARPGIETLYSPHFPQAHGTAIVSADRVITFRLLPALTAVANGVRAVLLAVDEVSRRTADALGIPWLAAEPGTNPVSLGRFAEELVRDYPWELVRERVTGTKGKFTHWLTARGLPPARPERPALTVVGGKSKPAPVHLASISDISYLPFLIGFIENAVAKHGADGVAFHVLGLDNETGPALKSHYPDLTLEVYRLEDLWEPHELPRILDRPVGFRAFSSKSRLLAKSLERVRAPIVYCDSDVFFFEPPRTLVEALGADAVLLFPHWNDVFSAARRDGLYNAGMIVVGPGAEPFLDWWSGMCLFACHFDHDGGVVGDQGYLDFVPAYFERVKSYQGGDQNAARWNLKTLGLALPDRLPLRPVAEPSEGRLVPLRTYHAAFIDELGVFEAKYAWDQLVTFFCVTAAVRRSRPLFQNTLVQQRRHWLTLSRLLVAHEKLGNRIGAAKAGLTPDVAAFFTGGFGRKVLPALARASRLMERFLPQPEPPPAAARDADFWIASQRHVLSRAAPPQADAKPRLSRRKTHK